MEKFVPHDPPGTSMAPCGRIALIFCWLFVQRDPGGDTRHYLHKFSFLSILIAAARQWLSSAKEARRTVMRWAVYRVCVGIFETSIYQSWTHTQSDFRFSGPQLSPVSHYRFIVFKLNFDSKELTFLHSVASFNTLSHCRVVAWHNV